MQRLKTEKTYFNDLRIRRSTNARFDETALAKRAFRHLHCLARMWHAILQWFDPFPTLCQIGPRFENALFSDGFAFMSIKLDRG